MSSILIINKDDLETARKEYAQYAERMETLRSDLEKAVSEIRGAWQSDGGEEFFKKYDDEWLKNFNDYIAVIKHMANNVQVAKNEYQAIFDEVKALKIN